MSSQTASREDGRSLSVRTLAIASIASATAAVVTSLFWKGGTPIAAAVTPVIVAVVSEMLHKPATVIAAKREQTVARVRGGGSSPTVAAREERLRRLPEPEPEMNVYRAPSRRKLAVKPIAATAAAAFVIAAALLTLPELIAGQSFGQGDRNTTLFGGSGKSGSDSSGQGSEAAPQEGAPDEPDETQNQDTREQTSPTPPPSEEPAPESPPAPPTTTPAPAAPGEPAP